MNWKTEWKAISDRITGISKAGELFLQFLNVKNSDPYGSIKKALLPQAREIFLSIKQFHEFSHNHLPHTANECIQRFITNSEQLFSEAGTGDTLRLQAVMTYLVSFQAEFTYQISDISFATQKNINRAFTHLSRSIIADIDIQKKWKEAFKSGETNCEKLGAAHLLLHGIWAFKASAEGERTDLILGEPLVDINLVESTAEALVLTEWKVVRNPKKELDLQASKALKQAKRYSSGILAGFELANYRYLVLVSKNALDMPEDIHENETIYKYINIAVDPLPPSKSN